MTYAHITDGIAACPWSAFWPATAMLRGIWVTPASPKARQEGEH